MAETPTTRCVECGARSGWHPLLLEVVSPGSEPSARSPAPAQDPAALTRGLSTALDFCASTCVAFCINRSLWFVMLR